jgi:hypothetical protein
VEESRQGLNIKGGFRKDPPLGSSGAVAGRELPRYKCHKEVWALKIKEVFQHGGGITSHGRTFESAGVFIVPEDGRYEAFDVEFAYVQRMPRAGGYYVVYEDGYKSYSPAEAFESGYTLI